MMHHDRCLVVFVAVLVVVFVVAMAACGSSKPDTNTETTVKTVIDCTTANRADVEALLTEFAPLLQGDTPNWQAVIDKATLAGAAIGGCALAELAQRRATTEAVARSSSAPVRNTRTARTVFEQFRADHADGAIYRTAKGEL